jgi:hypothetical protein
MGASSKSSFWVSFFSPPPYTDTRHPSFQTGLGDIYSVAQMEEFRLKFTACPATPWNHRCTYNFFKHNLNDFFITISQNIVLWQAYNKVMINNSLLNWCMFQHYSNKNMSIKIKNFIKFIFKIFIVNLKKYTIFFFYPYFYWHEIGGCLTILSNFYLHS